MDDLRYRYCEICDEYKLKKNWARHVKSKIHENKSKLIQENNLEYLKNIPFTNEENINNVSYGQTFGRTK